MPLWMPWWNAIWLLRPAFSRLRTFLWFATAVAGFTVRTELLGVTSLVRALKLEARFYNKLVDHFHSPAVKLDRLAALWTQVVPLGGGNARARSQVTIDDLDLQFAGPPQRVVRRHQTRCAHIAD